YGGNLLRAAGGIKPQRPRPGNSPGAGATRRPLAVLARGSALLGAIRYLGLAQVGSLAARRAAFHILRKKRGCTMRFIGTLMVLVCATALLVSAQDDDDR